MKFQRRLTALLVVLAGWIAGVSGVWAQMVPTGGVSLVSVADLAVQGSFWAGSTTGGAVAARTIVPAVGTSFAQAARIEVLRPTGQFWASAVSSPSNRALADGDVVLVHLFLRAIQTTDETGAVFCQVYAEGPAPEYRKSLSQQITAGPEWREYFLPFTVSGAYASGQFVFNLGFGGGGRPQVLEIGGVEMMGYGKSRTLAEMPRTAFNYDGRAANAAWRVAAAERIERLRKAAYDVRVVNSAGLPVSGARVRMRLERHAFHFGTAFQASRIVNQSTSDNQTYRRKLLELFSAGSTENDLKWPAWDGDWGTGFTRSQTLAALDSLSRQGLHLRGHVLVWPSERNLPNAIKALLPTRDASIPALVRTHIDDILTATRALVGEWDVLNEPFDNHDLMDLFGQSIMTDWFRRAHQQHPSAKLYINDYGILSGGGLNVAHQDHYEATIRFLLNDGAPLHGVGFQGHFEASPTGIPKVWSVLERYADAFPGLHFKITEFDVDADDEELQADYTRDFLTILFSHPSVVGFQMWGFWEGAHWRPRAAMYRRDWTEKPNGKAYRELVQGTWRTDETRIAEPDGRAGGRGFLGTYAIEVVAGGKTVSVTRVLTAEGLQAEVVIDVPVDPAPRIVQQPLGRTVAPGETVVLRVAVAGDPAPVVTWYRSGVSLQRTGQELMLSSGSTSIEGIYTADISNRHGSVTTRSVQVAVRQPGRPGGKLVNLSSRARVQPGEKLMIAGFVLAGPGRKPVLIRGIGPRLGDFGVAGVLADPWLRVDRAGQSTPIAETDTWAPELAARFAGVGAFALGGDTRSAALVLELEAGAYTAQLGGNAGGTGVALVEVYDASTGQPLELRNLSTRAEAGAGDDMLIAGLVITGDAPLPVLLRGVGPGLSAFGITGALVDPILRVYEPIPGGDSRLVATNDDWNLAADSGAVRSAAAAVGAFALNDFGRDASLLLHLEPGAYTVHLSGSSGSGLALLEVYSLPLP